MDFSQLTRNAPQVLAALQEMPDGRVIALREVKIYVPERFTERDMAYVGVENYILGIYAITVDDKYYGVSLVNAMLNIDPTTMNRIKYKDVGYLEFVFIAGSTVIKSLDLVKTDKMAYKIYDEFYSSGKVPWYIGYEEMGKLFNTARYHAGANVGTNREVTQIFASLVARDPNDLTKYYRQSIKSLSDLRTKPPALIPLKSVDYAATNTTTKLGGSYFDTGVISALNDPTDRVERIEGHLTR